MLKKIATILKEIGSLDCRKKAEYLSLDDSKPINLNLRSLFLKTEDVIAIASELNEENHSETIKSITFSYNKLLSDSGATALAKNLPINISEIGLVDCGITDKGGTEILNWMKTASQLRIVCIEQNNFSEELKSEFNLFKKDNPAVMFIF